MFLSLFKVAGNSMLPTFKPGQLLLVSSIPYLFKKPKVGDVVVVKDPRDGKPLLKRITEIVQSRHSGKRSDSRIPLGIRRFWTSQNDENTYFVTGDNFRKSTDSRSFGEITKENIIGKCF